MAIFKCKMCGGSLEITDNSTVMECEFCGTKQTLPKLDDERRLNLYDRANHFRRNNEFDKAMGIYEQILSEDTTDAESYWSIVLCKYGVEYVEDPRTKRRIPTVNRVQYTSVFDDENYKSAINCADESQKRIYMAEAEAINNIQKQYLDISKKEAPFDVFICYKETDERGKRTEDSVLAQDIYDRLSKEDLKVFFARITLEDKLGVAYEPYIFSALNSAKVMIAIGTRPEHLNSVWVKNEWSRYLALIAQGEDKTLIPAYRGMDAYSLPEEFSHLQGQDMSKIGFMQDLVHGVKKLVGKDGKKAEVKETAGVENVKKRIVIALEDGEFKEADRLLDQALNIEPENALLYVYRMMAELKVKTREELGTQDQSFWENNNYKRAMRFADDALKNELNGYHEAVLTRIKETMFRYAMDLYNSAKTADDFKHAAEIFKALEDYKNSEDMLEACDSMAANQANMEFYSLAMKRMNQARTSQDYKEVAALFNQLGDFRDAKELFHKCTETSHNMGKKSIYDEATVQFDKGNYIEASRLFDRIKGYEDANQRKIQSDEAAKKKAADFEKLQKRNKLKNKIKLAVKILAVVLVIAVIAGAIGYFTVVMPEKNYENALQLLENGENVEAIDALYKLNGYKDSNDRIKEELKKQVGLKSYVQSAAGGKEHTSVINSDGRVSSYGSNKADQCDTSEWKGIIQIDAGMEHTVGLRIDGTVLVAGNNKYLQARTDSWYDITMVSAGDYHTVGLKADGTVVAVGLNDDKQTKVEDWNGIVHISAGNFHTVGLKADGTSVATGRDRYGECASVSNAKAVYAGGFHTVYLMNDNTVKAVGYNNNGQCDVSDWNDIVQVAAGEFHTVGLKADGTVVAVGDNTNGQCDVSAWTDIVQVCVGYNKTIGIKSDGTTVEVGLDASLGRTDVLVK